MPEKVTVTPSGSPANTEVEPKTEREKELISSGVLGKNRQGFWILNPPVGPVSLVIDGGTHVQTPGANDDVTISFAIPFKGILSVVATQGDTTHTTGIEAVHSVTATQFKVRTAASGIVRVNWIAIGYV